MAKTKQSVRVQLKDGQEFEVADVKTAERVYPQGKILAVTTFDAAGRGTTEPYKAPAKKAPAKKNGKNETADMPADETPVESAPASDGA